MGKFPITLIKPTESSQEVKNITLALRVLEIPEAGHLPQVEAFPKYVRALLDFIGGG